jgi:E3 ubiquitin-protein ligase DOA10
MSSKRLDAQPELEPDPEPEAPPLSPTGDTPNQCRICFGGEGERDDDGAPLGELVVPCVCTGTQRHVHVACLRKWQRVSRDDIRSRVCIATGRG